MNAPARALRTSDRTLLWTIAGLLFVSGACALAYQQLWLRLLSLVFGVSVYAAATTLASFFAGLALGSFLGGRFADRTPRPLFWYGVAEVLIGLGALVTTVAFDAVEWLYVGMHGGLPDSIAVLTGVRFVLAFAVLIVPSTLMGATLPLVVRSAVFSSGQLGSRVSLIYAMNTAGAVVGTLAVGSWLIGRVGISRSFLIGALANLVVGVIAILSSRAIEQSRRAEAASATSTTATSGAEVPVPPEAVVAEPIRRIVLWVFAVSGFVSLALEIVWFRVLVLYFDATNYAFAIILATVLAGITAGSAAVGVIMRRRLPWLRVVAVVEVALAVASLASFLLLSEAAGFFEGGTLGSWRYVVVATVFAVFPATFLMGVAFPIGVRLWAAGSSHSGTGSSVGIFYSLNVTGGILGAVVAGFVLVPELGAETSLIVLSTVIAISGVVLLYASMPTARGLALTVAAAGAFAVVAVTAVPDPYRAALENRYPGERLVWEEEGTQSSVAIHETADGLRVMYIDGLHQASTAPDLIRFHRTIGALPMAVHPDPRRALVIGLGGGATPGAVAAHARAKVDVVELSPEVVRAARRFADINYEVVDRDNVDIRVDDGRNYLLLTDRRYDVITADVIRPGTAGAGKLWSLEYWRLVRAALRPGGVVMQWIGDERPGRYELIVRSFLEVFPHATLWEQGQLLIGTKKPLSLDRSDYERKLAHPRTRAMLSDVGLGSWDALIGRYRAGPHAIRDFVGPGPLLTDDRPRLEFFRPGGDDTPLDISGLRSDVAAVLRGVP